MIEVIKNYEALYADSKSTAIITDLSFKILWTCGESPLNIGEDLRKHLEAITDYPIKSQKYTYLVWKNLHFSALLKPLYNDNEVYGYACELLDKKAIVEILSKTDLQDDINNVCFLAHEKVNNLFSSISLLEEKLMDKPLFQELDILKIQRNHCRSLACILTNTTDYLNGLFFSQSKTAINLTAFLEAIILQSNIILSKSGKFIDYTLPKQAIIVNVAHRRLTNVIMNGLQNALLYSGVTPEVKVILQAVDGNAILTIENNGALLDESIFEDVGQSPSPYTFGRTGLGLAIIRNFMISHGGKFNIKPREEGGALLSLSFPISEEEHSSYFSSNYKDYLLDGYSPIKLFLGEFEV